MTALGWWAALLCGLAVFLAFPRPARRPGALFRVTVAGGTEGRSRQRGDGPRSGSVVAAVRTSWLAPAGAAVGAWVLVGGGLGVVLGGAAAVVSWRVLARAEPAAARRRREALERSAPHLVHLMAASLSAGSAPLAALAALTEVVDPPLRQELAPPVARLRLGADPAAVWADLARHPQLGPLGRCLLRAGESGAAVTDVLEELSAELRHRARTDVEARARSVGVKASAPLGLCLLPAFLVLGIVPLVAGLLPVLLGR